MSPGAVLAAARRRVVRWDLSAGLSTAAAIWGEGPRDLRAELAGIPAAVERLAVVSRPDEDAGAEAAFEAVALYLPPAALGAPKAALARVAVPDDAGVEGATMLIAWAEHQAIADGARLLEVTARRLPGAAAVLERLGFSPMEGMIRMRRTLPRPVRTLPDGLEERMVTAAGVDGWIRVANESFAAVPFSAPMTREDGERQLADPAFDAKLLRVVMKGPDPLAFLHGTLSEDGTGEVRAIGVVPRAQGSGLGRWTLRRCEQLLDERGTREVILRVAESNRTARGLYEREGYVEVSRTSAWQKTL